MTYLSLCRLTLCTSLMISFAALSMPSVNAGEPLRDSLQEVAERFAKVFHDEGKTSVNLGRIDSEDKDRLASYGRRIVAFLQQELEHQGIAISRRSSLMVSGTYKFEETRGTIVISLDVSDKRGNGIDSVTKELRQEIEVDDPNEVMLVSNVSVAVDHDDDSNAKLDTIRREINSRNGNLEIKNGFLVMEQLGLAMRLREVDPRFAANDRRFLGAEVSPVGVLEGHFALHEGRSYAVELKNLRHDVDFACQVLFDGIDTFVLCDDSEKKSDYSRGGRRIPKYKYWVVNREKPTVVPGWYKNRTKINAFQIVPDEESVAHAFGVSQGIGSIQVVVTAAWPKGDDVNEKYRLQNALAGARPRGGAGEGKSIEVDLKPVPMETGIVLGTFSAEYVTIESHLYD